MCVKPEKAPNGTERDRTAPPDIPARKGYRDLGMAPTARTAPQRPQATERRPMHDPESNALTGAPRGPSRGHVAFELDADTASALRRLFAQIDRQIDRMDDEMADGMTRAPMLDADR